MLITRPPHTVDSVQGNVGCCLLILNLAFLCVLQHADRTFHDPAGNVEHHDTGYWIVDMDQNSPHTVKMLVPEVAYAELVEDDCVQHVYCGMPYLMPALSFMWYVHDRILELLHNAVTYSVKNNFNITLPSMSLSLKCLFS